MLSDLAGTLCAPPAFPACDVRGGGGGGALAQPDWMTPHQAPNHHPVHGHTEFRSTCSIPLGTVTAVSHDDTGRLDQKDVCVRCSTHVMTQRAAHCV